MRKGQQRFVLEIITDASFFERVGNRNRFRYRQNYHYFRFTSLPRRAYKHAAKLLKRFLQKDRGLLHDAHIYVQTQWGC